MKPVSVRFLADACGGKIAGNGDAEVSGVKIDSRLCNAGDMFVCIIGESNDGHDYIASAYERGTRVFLVSKEIGYADAIFIVTDDTTKAFYLMASAYLNLFSVRKVAVTGSVGKTTTKMLTAAVLSSVYKTVCTGKNLNTGLGVSLTCFNVDESTEAVVFEMGMDQRGQIKESVSIVKPHLAIITNVGISHLENLGTRDAIADAKLEIVSEFNESDVLVVNRESDYLKTHSEIRERAVNKNKFHIVSVGQDLLIENIRSVEGKGIEFTVNSTVISLPLIGKHNAIDAALAIACGIQFGVSVKKAAQALLSVKATEKRLSVQNLGDIVLIDDSYNASPDSLKAAIVSLTEMKAKRRVLILGDMRELGSETINGHIAIGRYAAAMGIDLIVAFGENKAYYMKGVLDAKKNCNFVSAQNLEEIKKIAVGLVQPGDVVLVKGSNSTRISEVAELFRKKYERE